MIAADKVSTSSLVRTQYAHIVLKQYNALVADSQQIALFPYSLIRVIITTRAWRPLLCTNSTLHNSITIWAFVSQRNILRSHIREFGWRRSDVYVTSVCVGLTIETKMRFFSFHLPLSKQYFTSSRFSRPCGEQQNIWFYNRTFIFVTVKKHLLYILVKNLYCNRLETKSW